MGASVTLISTIIGDAYRESNMVALGITLTANQTAEALRLYNQMIAAIYGGEAGERLTDWPLGTFDRDPTAYDFEILETAETLHRPPPNQRLIALNLAPLTVEFPVAPQDGSRMGIIDPFGRLAAYPVTLDGNGRTIGGAATALLNTNGLSSEWIYRSDKGDWTKLNTLLATDDNPFPARFDIMFSIMLALRLNPRYGRTLDPQSQVMLKQNKREFVAQYLQSRPLQTDDSISWPFLSRQGYDTQRSFTSQRGFNRGNYWE